MNTIKCSNCGEKIEVDKALEGQIEARVLAAEHKKHEAELMKVRTEANDIAQKAAETDIEIAKKKFEAEMLSTQKKSHAEQDLLVQGLKEDAEEAKADNKKLRNDLTEMMKTLREEKRARENAELEAEKKMGLEQDKMREQITKDTDEKYGLKFAEYEKQLSDTKKALEEAQRKAAQGSQQNQGEVLELDLENRLTSEFPLDQIVEVKKGQRGADVKQIVHNQSGVSCGILLWETKNGKWQPAWVPKFKQDIREATASIGVIVSQEMPAEMGDMKHLDANVWVVKPRLATVLATALRATILQVAAANKNNQGKDAKMEALYQFLVGPEFRHRIEAIVENYGTLQSEIEKEKRAAALRWAHQEKAIRNVIDNTIGMYGDFQGITNRALPRIETLELPSGDELEAAE